MKKLLQKIDELTDYPVAFVIAALGWLLGLGITCVTTRAESGVYVKIHGWACQCNGGEQ